MSEIKFVELKCQRCGGDLEEKGDTYICKNCGKKWQKENLNGFTDMLEACEEALRAQRVADIANLRRLLWAETHKEFVSNIQVERLCADLQKYLPQDFYAGFYKATCSRGKTELGDFLYNVNVKERYDDIPLVMEYLLKALKPEWIMGVSNFIEKFKDIDLSLYNNYRTKFEEEFDKIEDCIFEPAFPRDVFIAYSSKDMPKVMELVAALEEEDLSCFVAARNMRHGSGSVEKYNEIIHTAIDHCTVIVFVSSDNSRSVRCDAYRELDYVTSTNKRKPRVEFLIQNYRGRATERFFSDFFDGLEYCTTAEDVTERVIEIIMKRSADSESASAQEDIARKNKELQQQIEEERRKAQELQLQIAQAERARLEAEAERKAREEEERRRKEEEERKRREEAEARARAEATQRAEQERQRKLREEEERRRREEEERRRREEAEARARVEDAQRAELERQRKLQEEQERKRRKAEEARNALLNLGNYKDSGNGYITFGAYPQSKKASSVTIGEIFDKERGYYLGSDNSLYEKYNGEYYKVEPIKWKVLSNGSEQFIVSDIILDAHRFDEKSNNYANSEIRSWLNGEFYNKAFKQEQKNKIVTTNVDNSLASTGDKKNKYVCSNTSDKIFLLSHKEAEQYFNSSSARQKKGTDYAKARNLYVADNGYSWWWLRSPYDSYRFSAQDVGLDGDFYISSVYDSSNGVVCALKFKP